MKLQLDLDNKVIRVEGSVNLLELYDTLKRLLPQGEWKEFSIESNTIITWVNPITVPYYIPVYPRPYNPYPWWITPDVKYQQDNKEYSISYSLGTRTYNIQT